MPPLDTVKRMCLLAVLLAIGNPARIRAGDFAWSAAAFAAAQAADSASSYGLRELNPVLADAHGRFGVKGVAWKAGITGGVVLGEMWVVKKRPRSRRAIAIANLVAAGVTAALAVHNVGVR